MRQSSRLPLCLLVLALLLSVVDCRAEAEAEADDRSGVRQYGFSVGYGFSDRASVEVIPFLVHAAWLFPDFIDEPLHRYNVDFMWVPEFWVAGKSAPLRLKCGPLAFGSSQQCLSVLGSAQNRAHGSPGFSTVLMPML